MEAKAEAYFERIEELGGVIPAIEKGYFQREIARSAYQYQAEIENKDRIIVGVNDFCEADEKIEIPLLQIPPEVEKNQRNALKELRDERDDTKITESLAALKQGARSDENLMPLLINCAKNYVTLGEMVNVLKEVFGEYVETTDF